MQQKAKTQYNTYSPLPATYKSNIKTKEKKSVQDHTSKTHEGLELPRLPIPARNPSRRILRIRETQATSTRDAIILEHYQILHCDRSSKRHCHKAARTIPCTQHNIIQRCPLETPNPTYSRIIVIIRLEIDDNKVMDCSFLYFNDKLLVASYHYPQLIVQRGICIVL